MKKVLRKLYRAVPFKGQIFKVLRPILPLNTRVYRHLNFVGEFNVPINNAVSFKMKNWGNQIENDLFWAGFGKNWESTSLRLWVNIAQKMDVVLDIGANTGVFALSAKAINTTASVAAFEPVSRVHSRLANNVKINGYDIETVEAGASDSSGTATIYDTPDDHVYSASLNPEMLAARDDLIEKQINIIKMDEFVATKNFSGDMLVKVDTEMHEHEVLSGFKDTIKKLKPTFLVEILNQEFGSKIETLFKGKGYLFFEVQEKVGVFPTQHLGISDRNYLICPKSKAIEFGLVDGVQHSNLIL